MPVIAKKVIAKQLFLKTVGLIMACYLNLSYALSKATSIT